MKRLTSAKVYHKEQIDNTFKTWVKLIIIKAVVTMTIHSSVLDSDSFAETDSSIVTKTL